LFAAILAVVGGAAEVAVPPVPDNVVEDKVVTNEEADLTLARNLCGSDPVFPARLGRPESLDSLPVIPWKVYD
jgi:hypothetical protein